MTWDINNFATLSRYVEGDTVTFGDDAKGTIIGIGNIKIGASPLIENVVLVDGLNIIYLVLVNYVIVVSKLFLMNLLAKFLIVKPMIVFSLDFVKIMSILLICLIWIALQNV